MILPRKQKKARLELAAMLDVIFIVLIFLIYAMLSMNVEKGEIVNLPSSNTAMTDDNKDSLALHILTNGELRLDGKTVSTQELGIALKNFGDAKPLIRIFGDGGISYQQLYQVLDILQENGFSKISLQAKND